MTWPVTTYIQWLNSAVVKLNDYKSHFLAGYEQT